MCSIVENRHSSVKARAPPRENLWFCAARRSSIDDGRTNRSGILAYGSLLTRLGAELDELIERRIDGVPTPFAVVARAASRRSGAPTLAPVERGGAGIFGALLVLHSGVDLERVRDALYRREINQVGTELTYDPHEPPSPDRVRIGHLRDHLGCAHLLYAQLPATLEPDPTDLARRAIASAEATAGAEGRDGISYLMGIKANGIETPLTPPYEAEILRQTGASDLAHALTKVRLESDGHR